MLIEARQGADGRVQVLAVLDLDRDALAAEAKRLATNDGAGPAVEVIDRATWLAMRRLQSSGMLQFVDEAVRVLHRAPELADTEERPAIAMARAGGASRQGRAGAPHGARAGDRRLSGGSAAAARKAIGYGAAAKLSALGELPVGASMATPAQVRDLVERNALPSQAASILAALAPMAGAPSGAEVSHLLEATAHVLAACEDGIDARSCSGGVPRAA